MPLVSLFITPENIRKPEVLRYFQGLLKEIFSGGIERQVVWKEIFSDSIERDQWHDLS